MIFFLITFFGMYIGRKLGWFLSKRVLYVAPLPLVVLLPSVGSGRGVRSTFIDSMAVSKHSSQDCYGLWCWVLRVDSEFWSSKSRFNSGSCLPEAHTNLRATSPHLYCFVNCTCFLKVNMNKSNRCWNSAKRTPQTMIVVLNAIALGKFLSEKRKAVKSSRESFNDLHLFL